ncbi:hypothetical protein [Microbacterium aurantiacum]|uniref:hypothetical protein n=1 Tax=Microbacterium aurantiacum TaxID=162393 RepID=UPI000C80099D|nr:hypothetical protein [Microbacterium aurantiacum]
MTNSGGVAAKAGAFWDRAWRSLLAASSAPVWIAAITAMAVILTFIALGGLRPAENSPTLTPTGAEARTSLYAVTVLSAELTDAIDKQFLEAEPGDDLLIVTVRLENLTSQAVGVDQGADRVKSQLIRAREPLLTLYGVTATDDARAWRTDGSLRGVILQPGVPAEVQLVWPVPEDSFPDGIAYLDVFDARERTGQAILSASAVTWRRTELATRIAVEVRS